MIYDVGDVIRIRSGSGTDDEQTLVFVVDSVNLSTRTVGVRCVNPLPGRPAPAVLPFRRIELLEV